MPLGCAQPCGEIQNKSKAGFPCLKGAESAISGGIALRDPYAPLDGAQRNQAELCLKSPLCGIGSSKQVRPSAAPMAACLCRPRHTQRASVKSPAWGVSGAGLQMRLWETRSHCASPFKAQNVSLIQKIWAFVNLLTIHRAATECQAPRWRSPSTAELARETGATRMGSVFSSGPASVVGILEVGRGPAKLPEAAWECWVSLARKDCSNAIFTSHLWDLHCNEIYKQNVQQTFRTLRNNWLVVWCPDGTRVWSPCTQVFIWENGFIFPSSVYRSTQFPMYPSNKSRSLCPHSHLSWPCGDLVAQRREPGGEAERGGEAWCHGVLGESEWGDCRMGALGWRSQRSNEEQSRTLAAMKTPRKSFAAGHWALRGPVLLPSRVCVLPPLPSLLLSLTSCSHSWWHDRHPAGFSDCLGEVPAPHQGHVTIRPLHTDLHCFGHCS